MALENIFPRNLSRSHGSRDDDQAGRHHLRHCEGVEEIICRLCYTQGHRRPAALVKRPELEGEAARLPRTQKVPLPLPRDSASLACHHKQVELDAKVNEGPYTIQGIEK